MNVYLIDDIPEPDSSVVAGGDKLLLEGVGGQAPELTLTVTGSDETLLARLLVQLDKLALLRANQDTALTTKTQDTALTIQHK